MAEQERGSISVREAGRRGGLARKQTMTAQHYADIGRKGGTTTRDRYGKAHYSQLGKEGGETLLRQHGPGYYSRLGKMKKGGGRVQETAAPGPEKQARDEAE